MLAESVFAIPSVYKNFDMQFLDNFGLNTLINPQPGRFKVVFIQKAINLTLESGEGEKIVLVSKGIDEKGDVVSSFEYEWSLKVKR